MLTAFGGRFEKPPHGPTQAAIPQGNTAQLWKELAGERPGLRLEAGWTPPFKQETRLKMGQTGDVPGDPKRGNTLALLF